jgi:hypothetical protein
VEPGEIADPTADPTRLASAPKSRPVEATMPALPWTTFATIDPTTECTVMASRLPLRSHRDIPRFLLSTLRIRRQLANTPGILGYALDAHLIGKTFWTVSAWTSRADLGRFDRADPHARAKSAIRPVMRRSTFVFWNCPAADLPIRWDEVRRRIHAVAGSPRSHA